MMCKTSWKGDLGGLLVWLSLGGLHPWIFGGKERTVSTVVGFFHMGLEFSWEVCLPLDPHPCPDTQADALGWGLPPAAPQPAQLPGHPGEPHSFLAWDLRSPSSIPWAPAAKPSGGWMLLGSQETRELVRSWQYVCCANETRWEDEHILCRSQAVFTSANWMWIKTNPGKAFLVRGEAAC